MLSAAGGGQQPSDFDDFLRRYAAADAQARSALAQSFVASHQAHGGFPIVEGDEVVFLYLGNGAEREVRVVGDFRLRSFFNVYWDDSGDEMSRVGALFYRRHRFERDARLDYAFVVAGRKLPDPLNPRRIFSGPGGGEVSELVMPGHRVPAETLPRAEVAHGVVRVVTEAWAIPKVTVYLPPGHDPAHRYPTLYTADGSAWLEHYRLPTILDNLIAAGAIEPLVAVMIDAAEDRRSWYYFNPAYVAYLERVVDHVDRHYSTAPEARRRVHAGSSAGARIALHVALDRPQLFSGVILLSPEASGPLSYYEPYFSGRRRPPPGLRAWLSAGSYEGVIHSDTQALESYLRRAGSEVRAVYTHQGHSFGAWRELVIEALRYFFPSSAPRLE